MMRQTLLKSSPAGLGSSAIAPVTARRAVRTQAVTATEAPPAVAAPSRSSSPTEDGLADIYVGKGRYVKGNPAKYPGKDDLGPLVGATGGWAGGEAGLWQLREQLQREKAAKRAATQAVSGSSSGAAVAPKLPAPADGKQPIYVGYGKDELEVRKAGVPGRFVLDDPRKYPAKEDLGFLAGATGGFAGGEKGVEQYVATGDITLRDPKQPSPRQSSPVAIAGLLVAAGAGGGLLLNQVTDLGENAVKGKILEAPIDDKTKGLLLVAVGLLAAVGGLATGKALIDGLQSRMSAAGDQAGKLVIGGAFWLAVFVAARAILEL